ncbi:hypothetical protein CCP3SC15_210015 [Gammaproteobacteria bacterium]
MTLSTSLCKHVYDGNGNTTEWPFTFKILAASDILVYRTDPFGGLTQLTSNYIVDVNGQKVVFPASGVPADKLPDGWKITLLRKIPMTQEVDLTNQGDLGAEVIEASFDRQMMCIQQLQEQIDRCIKYPVDQVLSDGELSDLLSQCREALSSAQAAVATSAANTAVAEASAVAAAASAAAAVAAVNSVIANALGAVRMTEAERDAKTDWTDGDIVSNKTIHKLQQWDAEAGTWQTFAMA